MRHVASLLGVVAGVGLLVAGSQAIRTAALHPRTADVSASPSALPTPDCQFAIDPVTCAHPTPTCVAGEGVECPGPVSVAPAVATAAPSATDQPANSRPPAGQIAVSATWMVVPSGSEGSGGKLGLIIAVLAGSDWVTGAQVSARCSGPSFDQSISGATAPRATWPVVTGGPNPPTGPATFFWAVLRGTIGQDGTKYACHGTASYNGVSGSF